MTTARDAMTATINAAIARYDQAIGDNMWRTTARNQAVEHILRGWERTVTHAVETALAEHKRAEQARRQEAARPLLQAVHAIKAGSRG